MALTIREKMKKKELLVEAMLRIPDSAVAEIMARSNIDLIMIDSEHFAFDEQQIGNIIRTVEMCGKETIVRVPRVDHELIGKILDMGANGILIPQIGSYEEAKAAVDAVKYAPIGKRGFCPFSKAAHFGLDMSPQEYRKAANDKTIIAVIIESREGVEALDQILMIPEIDSIHIGVSDLTHSYGLPGQYHHPLIEQIVEQIMKKVAESEKALTITTYDGIFCTPDMAEDFAMEGIKAGASNMQIPCDLQVLVSGYRQIVKKIRKV